jgi:hypothetical protein
MGGGGEGSIGGLNIQILTLIIRVQRGLVRVQHGLERVQRGLGCSWLAVRQARVRISARHPMAVPPTEPTAMKIWRWASANVYE